MFSSGLLWNILVFNFFAVVYVMQHSKLTSNSTFVTELTSALDECSVPLPIDAEDISDFTFSVLFNSSYDSAENHNKPRFAAYRKSNTDYEDYGNDDNNSKRKSRGRSKSGSRSDDSGDDDDESGSSSSSNRSSGSDGSSTSNDRTGSDTQLKNTTDKSRNSTSKKKADVTFSRDDNSYYHPEESDMRDRVPVNGYGARNNRGSASKNSNNSNGLQQIVERQKRALRYSRGTYNTEDNRVSACTIQCMLAKIGTVDARGFPSEILVSRFLEESITDEELFITTIRYVNDCFKKVNTGLEEDSCEFSKKFTDCLGLEFKKTNSSISNAIGKWNK